MDVSHFAVRERAWKGVLALNDLEILEERVWIGGIGVIVAG